MKGDILLSGAAAVKVALKHGMMSIPYTCPHCGKKGYADLKTLAELYERPKPKMASAQEYCACSICGKIHRYSFFVIEVDEDCIMFKYDVLTTHSSFLALKKPATTKEVTSWQGDEALDVAKLIGMEQIPIHCDNPNCSHSHTYITPDEKGGVAKCKSCGKPIEYVAIATSKLPNTVTPTPWNERKYSVSCYPKNCFDANLFIYK